MATYIVPYGNRVDGRPKAKVGDTWNSLKIERLAKDRHGKPIAVCTCKCGHEKTTLAQSLRNGRTRSCGCARKAAWNKHHVVTDPNQQAANALFIRYKHTARRRKLVFELTKNEFLETVAEPCHYCGEKPFAVVTVRTGHGANGPIGKFVYTGLDRLDNSKGYTKSNIVPACKVCNTAKNTMSIHSFTAWVLKVAARLDLPFSASRSCSSKMASVS